MFLRTTIFQKRPKNPLTCSRRRKVQKISPRHQSKPLKPRGDGGVAGAKTLILGGFAELLARYEVVFLRKMRWISFHR